MPDEEIFRHGTERGPYCGLTVDRDPEGGLSFYGGDDGTTLDARAVARLVEALGGWLLQVAPCPACGGERHQGDYWDDGPCSRCDGSGWFVPD